MFDFEVKLNTITEMPLLLSYYNPETFQAHTLISSYISFKKIKLN